MSAAGYIGVRAGERHQWFVPARFRERWLSQGDRLVRELRAGEAFEDTKPVILSRAKKISAGPSSVSPQESVDAGQPEEKATQRPNRKKGR